MLNEDLEHISLLESDGFPRTAQTKSTDKISRFFNVDPLQSKRRKLNHVSDVGLPQVTPAVVPSKVDIAEQLRNRLYDKPENSDVLVNAHLQSQKVN